MAVRMLSIVMIWQLNFIACSLTNSTRWFIKSNHQQMHSCFDEIVGEIVWTSGLKMLRKLSPDLISNYLVSITEKSTCSDIPWNKEGFQGLSLKLSCRDHTDYSTATQCQSNKEGGGVRTLVSKESRVLSHLKACDTPIKFDILKIDSLQYTCDLASQILLGGFMPTMILARVNSILPPPIRYVVHVEESVGGGIERNQMGNTSFETILQSGMAGCSFSHLSDILRAHEFRPAQHCHDVAVFLRKEIALDLLPKVPNGDLDVWRRGCAEDLQTGQKKENSDTVSSLFQDIQSDIISHNLSSLVRISLDRLSNARFEIVEANSDHKFRIFEQSLCSRCLLRGIQCGCHLGAGNPAFVVLRDFLRRMHIARNSNYEAPLKWVVVQVMGGIGNQQLQIVTGLMLAIATGRALALDHSYRTSGLAFVYDSVFDFPFANQVLGFRDSEARQRKSKHLVFDKATIELFLCHNLVETLGGWDVLDLSYGQSPHVMLANPHHGHFLNNSFWGKPYFFLSNFVWIGHDIRQVHVRFSTAPVPQPWDGVQSLQDFMSRVRSSNVARIIGVHTRIYSKRAFEYFDHRYFNGSDVLNHSSYCSGHAGSLEDFQVCIGHQIELERSNVIQPTSSMSSSVQSDRSIVILWATDNDDLAVGLLQYLQSIRGVHLVRILHESAERFDLEPNTGMVDLAMLEESDILIGTTSSTYSYAAHARGLIEPFYPSFRRNRSAACGKTVSTEGGLLVYGMAHDQCNNNQDPSEMICARLEPSCLQFLMAGNFIGNCLQEIGHCLGGDIEGDISWAMPYLIDVELSIIQSNYLARNNFRFHTEYVFPHFSSCIDDGGPSEVEAEGSETLDRFQLFQRVVCSKCATRGLQCGCDLKSENPTFRVLLDFVERMETARELNYNSRLKWIVIKIMGGLGNQQLQLVFGVLLALLTGRGLALDLSHNADPVEGRNGHEYVYDSVVHLPKYDVLIGSSSVDPAKSESFYLGEPDVLDVFLDPAKSFHLGEPEVLEVICTDFQTEFQAWDFVHISWGQSPHVLLANPRYAGFLKKAFWDKPFFFLSHFVWIGHDIRQTAARFSTLPVSQPWDGVRSLEDFTSQVRSSNVLRVIGVHIRVHTSKPFIYFDHQHFNGSDGLEDSSYCSGQLRSLVDIQECIGHLIQSNTSAHLKPLLTDRSVVIFWATDNDELTDGLLQHLQSFTGVHVVRILHKDSDRTDQLPWTAMLDLAMLEEADVLIGTTLSTFSFAAHARGLIRPYYPSFRSSRSLSCGKPTGTEGGLLFYGAMYDECLVTDLVKIKCLKFRPDCLHFTAGSVFFRNCLQYFGVCLVEDLSWASPYFTDLDVAAVNVNFLARRSTQFEFGDPPVEFRTCPAVSKRL